MDQRINDNLCRSTAVVNLIFMSLPGTNFPWIVAVAGGRGGLVFIAVLWFYFKIKAFSPCRNRW